MVTAPQRVKETKGKGGQNVRAGIVGLQNVGVLNRRILLLKLGNFMTAHNNFDMGIGYGPRS